MPRMFKFTNGLAERIAFALKVDIFALVWMVIEDWMVSKGYFRSAAAEPRHRGP